MLATYFNASNIFRGLEEALHVILEENDDREYEIAIIPPDPSVVTDEEEGADEDMVTHSLPRDVSGNIEVIVHNSGSLSSDYDSSDEEPLAARRVRWQQQTEQQVQPHPPKYNLEEMFTILHF